MLLLSLSAFSFLQVDSYAQDSSSSQFEEAALRSIVEKFFSAYGKKDLAGVVALWSEKSPNLATSKKTLQQRTASEDQSFSNPAISRVKVEGEKASLRVTIALTTINLKTQQKSEQRLVSNFEFVKEGGEWKVWRYFLAAEDLAGTLVKVDSKAEQAKLLAEE